MDIITINLNKLKAPKDKIVIKHYNPKRIQITIINNNQNITLNAQDSISLYKCFKTYYYTKTQFVKYKNITLKSTIYDHHFLITFKDKQVFINKKQFEKKFKELKKAQTVILKASHNYSSKKIKFILEENNFKLIFKNYNPETNYIQKLEYSDLLNILTNKLIFDNIHYSNINQYICFEVPNGDFRVKKDDLEKVFEDFLLL